MFNTKQKTKKIIASIAVFSVLLMQLFPLGVRALTIPDSFINASKGSSVSISNSTKAGNASANDPNGISNKNQGPKVEVSFSSADGMKRGSKITATATPSFFASSSDIGKLYFTWYLKRSGCDNKVNVANNPTLKSKCDFDGDDRITENDWKIAAAKIIASGSFDSNETDTAGAKVIDYSVNVFVGDKKSAFQSVTSNTTNETNWNNRCYVQEPKSGLIYELTRVKQEMYPCPAGYDFRCVADNQSATCDVFNDGMIPGLPGPYDFTAALNSQNDIATKTAANAASLAYNSAAETNLVLSNPSDPTSAKIIDMVTYPAYPKAIVAIPAPYAVALNGQHTTNSFCGVVGGSNSVYCKIDGSDNIDNIKIRDYTATSTCSIANAVPTCVKNAGTYTDFPGGGNPATAVIFQGSVCNSLQSAPSAPGSLILPAPGYVPPFVSTENSIFGAVHGQSCADAKNIMINGDGTNAGVADIDLECTFIKDTANSGNACKHLFANPKLTGDDSGDGRFSLAEKKFWGLDPAVVSTRSNGQTDEENVIGKGIDKFTWMFSPGDMVGLAVEGDSVLISEHADASNKRMWAFSNNTCKALEDISKLPLVDGADPDNSFKRGFYLERGGGEKCDLKNKSICTGFLTAEVDLDSCLEENLLNPDLEGTSKLKVDLAANLQNPINDPNGRGDILTISSGSSNASDPGGLLYKWTVQRSNDGINAPTDTTGWTDITTAATNNDPPSFSSSDLVGINKKSFTINLNLPNSITGPISESVFWLRFRVKISGTSADDSQNAEGVVNVRVRKQQNQIYVYDIIASNVNDLKLDKSSELCGDTQGKIRCFVNKNAIIGLEIPNVAGNVVSNFIWTVNGNPMECRTSISSECVLAGNKLFFPILGNEGEAVDVVASGLSSSGEKIEVSRHFVIAGSQLQILLNDPNGKSFSQLCSADCGSSNDTCPRYLGKYKDIVGGEYPDCSSSVFETKTGKTVSFSANSQSGFNWTIDGVMDPQYSDQQTITLPIEKLAGSSYSIELSSYLSPANKAQLTNVRLALFKNWAISQEEVPEENQTTAIQLDVFADPNATIASNGGFGASLITHLPEQLMFLLKISLTSIFILLVSGLLFAFMPEDIFRKEN